MENEKITAGYDKLLMGIGAEWKTCQDLGMLAELAGGTDFYLVASFPLSQQQKTSLTDRGVKEERLVCPKENQEEMENWESYLTFIKGLLNHAVLILELGEGFADPAFMRWPFEKMAYFNQKAHFIRVNESFYQIPADLKGRGEGIKENSVQWARERAELF